MLKLTRRGRIVRNWLVFTGMVGCVWFGMFTAHWAIIKG